MEALDLGRLCTCLAEAGGRIQRIVVFGTVGSTQDEAASLALAGAPAGTLVVAAAQTAGRGRVGRSWHSPSGGMYASLVLRPAEPPSRWPVLAVMAGTALAEALSGSGVLAVTVKWPNDVLVGGRKVAGLLAESHAEDGFAVLGLGLNVLLDRDLPPGIRDIATDLGSHVPASADATEVCAGALAAIAAACIDGSTGLVLDPLRASRWLDRSREVAVAGVRGWPAGITAEGELVLDVPGGTSVRISMGEVSDARGD